VDEQTVRPAARRVLGRSPDGRRWDLAIDQNGVTVTMAGSTVAEAHVRAGEGHVVIDFWLDGADLPSTLGAQLVGQAFHHPAVRPHAPVVVRIPVHDGGLLEHARRHVDDATTRAAGMTCMVEGRVRDDEQPCGELTLR
jgi:hypothetical protein